MGTSFQDRVRRISPAKRAALVLLLIVLLPALFYSGYEINSLSSSEQLIERVYAQQLDAILFSLNQYSWDVVSNWASTISMLRQEHAGSGGDLEQGFSSFFAKNPPLKAVVFADSSMSRFLLLAPSGATPLRADQERAVQSSLRANRDKLERLARLRRLEYRKIEPLSTVDTTSPSILLAFAGGPENEPSSYVAMLLDERSFIENVLASRLREVAGSEFVIAVYAGSGPEPVFTTEPVSPDEVQQKKLLWLFPEYRVGIALKGATVQGILRGRFNRSLVLIGLLDIILIAGVWLVYRSMRREMELVRMKSAFVSNVSHELRTPLSLIRMYAETLEMGRVREDSKKQEYIETILAETERLTKLVNNILSFSRMDAGKRQFRFGPVALNLVVARVVDTYREHLERSGFRLEVISGENLPTVRGDEESIAEALINILDNAVKFSLGEKHIRISTTREGSAAALAVQDRGVGIAPEHKAKIFDTFYRVSDGLVHTTKGSGLGLALVRSIMDAHGGSIRLESAPGKGSTFTLLFPGFVQS